MSGVVAALRPSLTPDRVEAYLDRLGVQRSDVANGARSLRMLHCAHLERIPFENLDIVFADGVPHDQVAAVDKIVGVGSGGHRGGWCFELNGAFALLLAALGFDVRMLGAAVLLGGPNQVIDHLLLEVSSPELAPHLVDVGFGDSFDVPLALNTLGPQHGGSGEFELIASPQGTTLARSVDGVPSALLRFKRVAHAFEEFAAIARSLQVDPTKHWASKPFSTRRLTDDETRDDPGSGEAGRRRVTLTHDRIKVERGDRIDEQQVDRDGWDGALAEWFGTVRPGPWPVRQPSE